MICNSTLNDHSNVCGNCERSSCTVCIVLFITAFLIIFDVSSTFVYFYWYLQRDNICVNYIILYCVILCYIIIYYIMSCYTMLFYIILYYIILY